MPVIPTRLIILRGIALQDTAERLGTMLLYKPFDPGALKAYLAGLPG
jgi:hypothetical protein